MNCFFRESDIALLRMPQRNRYRANAIEWRGFLIRPGEIVVANSARPFLAAVRLLVKQNLNSNASVRIFPSFIHNTRDRYRVHDILHGSEYPWVQVSHGCG